MIYGFEKHVMEMIRREFKESDRFSTIQETRKYRKGEDPFISAQAKEKIPSVCEVYFDGKYLCDVESYMQPKKALALIQLKLLERTKNKKTS